MRFVQICTRRPHLRERSDAPDCLVSTAATSRWRTDRRTDRHVQRRRNTVCQDVPSAGYARPLLSEARIVQFRNRLNERYDTIANIYSSLRSCPMAGLVYTRGEVTSVTSQSLWSRYDRHLVGITRHDALMSKMANRVIQIKLNQIVLKMFIWSLTYLSYAVF